MHRCIVADMPMRQISTNNPNPITNAKPTIPVKLTLNPNCPIFAQKIHIITNPHPEVKI